MNKTVGGIGYGLRAIEIVLAEHAAGVVSLFGGILPAGMAFDGMTTALGLKPWLAWAGLIVIEGLNIGATSTALMLWRRGDVKRFRLALGAVVFYVASVVTVNVLLDDGDWRHKLAKGLLSSVSIVGAVVVALRMIVRDDEAREQVEAEREAMRQEEEAARRRQAEADALAYQRQVETEAREAKRAAAAERRQLKQTLALAEIEAGKVSGKFPAPEKVAGNLLKDENLPETYGKWTDWRKVPTGEREKIANLADKDAVIWHYGVSKKTAENWLKAARAQFLVGSGQ